MKKTLLLLLYLSFSSAFSFGQLHNDSLEYRLQPDTLKAKTLALSIYNFNFLRNYEFFNAFQDGYTLFGTQLEPRLNYYVNSKLVISAGANVRKDYGRASLNQSVPVFTLKYKNKHHSLITGAIEGNVSHRFIEPVFDFERKITNPIEYGTQFIVDKPSLFLDAFVNWNRMTERYSSLQEQIYGGLSSDVTLYRNEKIEVSVPLQAFIFHQGGQIDTDPSPLQTKLNTAAGFKIQLSADGFISRYRTENYIVSYRDVSPDEGAIYNEGRGVFFNAGIDTKTFGSLMLSYWDGYKFLSSAGMPIYRSVSTSVAAEGYLEDRRKLVFVRYVYQKQLVSNLFLDFRIEPVFDLKSNTANRMEFYHSMFLLYKQDFDLFKRK